MSFWKRLFGSDSSGARSTAPKPPLVGSGSGEAKADRPSSPLDDLSPEWHRFFDNAPLHESARGALVAFVRTWPKDLDPDWFSSAKWPGIVAAVRAYISMPYPVAMLRSDTDSPAADYRMIDGKVARASNPLIDMILCQVLPAGEPADDEPQMLVWRLIERYSEWPLARLIFLLPRLQDGSEGAASGKAAILVIEDLLIQVYKGVENALFDVYEGLPEGGRLSDALVERRLLSLVTASTD